MNNLINDEFLTYLNRYLNSIIICKDKINSISIRYELSQAFSNHSCRFIIDVEFGNFESLSAKEKQIASKLLYRFSYSNESGYGFVSFIYKPQRNNYVDFETIKDFILHYQFAENLFNGFLRDSLSDKCKIEIVSLWDEPLFNYAINFLNSTLYDKSGIDQYKTKVHRSFDFDVHYHNILDNESKKYGKIEKSISDKEIFEKTDSNPEDIRRLVVNRNIPFNINSYSIIIDKIYIDISKLSETLRNYTPSNFEEINSNQILILIAQIEKKDQEVKLQLENSIINSGLQYGDVVLVEKDYIEKKCQDIGLVKEFELDYYHQLNVIYNKLKINLKESKLPNKSTKIVNISYIIKGILLEKSQFTALKNKSLQVKEIKKMGTRNKLFKNKRR